MGNQDRDLVQRILGGDLRAFVVLDSKYRALSQQEAFRLVGDPFEADDVVQEAFLRAYIHLKQLSDPSRFSSWLASIVRRAALDHVRRRLKHRVQTIESTKLDGTEVSLFCGNPNAQGDDWMDRDTMEKLLSELSPALREVVQLRAEDNVPLTEISNRLNIPLGTVKRRLHDARKKMRRLSMKKFDEMAARDIISAAAKDINNLPDSVHQDILGVAVGGDLIRGDFVPNNSNLLIFPLLSNRRGLDVFVTPAYRAIAEIFDKHCRPYYDCAESPGVWENLTFDEIHLPASAERFDPPAIPQPHWHSMYLFDLVDHHQMIFGEDFIKDLYRPDPRGLVLRMASEIIRLMRSARAGRRKTPAGFETLARWQVLKMIRLLQLAFSDGEPTIQREQVLRNYRQFVPDFPLKSFGEKLWKQDLSARYPADRKEYSDQHEVKCNEFIQEAAQQLLNR